MFFAHVVPPTFGVSAYSGGDMKAMVLAAGYGERMKPLTWDRAKPALPLLYRPSILHLLEHLARNGITEVAINLHYRPESIRALESRILELGLRVTFLEEAVILGTGGGLKNAQSCLSDGTVFMVNSDFVTDCSLLAVLDLHKRTRALATLVLTPYKEGTEYGAVEMDDTGRILRIAGRPGKETGLPRYHFTGIHVMDSRIFSEIPPGVKSEINREVYPRLIERGERISGFVQNGFWKELGTPERYLEGALDLLARGDAPYLQKIRIREGVYSASPSTSLLGQLQPPFLAGAGTKMESGSLAAASSLGDRVLLERGARLERCVLWDEVRVGEGADLHECIAGFGARVPAGARLRRKIILDEATYLSDRKGLERMEGLLVASF
jgi:NDP-sugar pyrophosphorylase family protein